MPIQYTTTDSNGVRHSRSTFNRRDLPVPAWIAAIGSSGGVHSPATCSRCAVTSMLSVAAALSPRTVSDDGVSDDVYFAASLKEQTKQQDNAYRTTSDDVAESYDRACDRIRQRAERTPVRRLRGVISELEGLSAMAYAQAESLTGQAARGAALRYLAAESAILVAQDRLAKAVVDPRDAASLANVESVQTIHPSAWSNPCPHGWAGGELTCYECAMS